MGRDLDRRKFSQKAGQSEEVEFVGATKSTDDNHSKSFKHPVRK